MLLNLSDAVDFLTTLLGMPYSVVTAQQACSTEINDYTESCTIFAEMVKTGKLYNEKGKDSRYTDRQVYDCVFVCGVV